MTPTTIRARLLELQDPAYKVFQKKLMPNVAEENIIGVRMPALRQFAKELANSRDYGDFLQELPHRYYDEYNLHGILISGTKDFAKAVAQLDDLLPYVDNWATCDIIRPKAFEKNKKLLVPELYRWMASDHTYTVRFGIEMAMTFYLDDEFDMAIAEHIAEIRSGEYYINMMIAWYFATALAKQWDSVLPILTGHRLDRWTHNKTIQKAMESYRITDEQKACLRAMKSET